MSRESGVSRFCGIISALAELERVYGDNEQNGLSALFGSFVEQLDQYVLPAEIVETLAYKGEDPAIREWAATQAQEWARRHRFMK